MVFVAGPHQVGKTTLARSLAGASESYLSWDIAEHRERILRRELPVSDLWVFDEIHKYRSWRNYLKGLHDGQQVGRPQRILVTGSARLDLYRFGGDSLQGRYHLLRLHPFSAAELDLRTEAELGNLELLMLSLPARVGSPLSLNSLREDLGVAHRTVSSWITVLERLYAIFRLAPFGAPRLRAVRKEQKHYHLDWSLVEDMPARFENLVACHLLKWVHFQQDSQGRDLELRYFRDVDRREVDFVVVEGRRPILLVECKWSDTAVDRGLGYLSKRFPGVDAWQISATGKRDYRTPEGIRVAPALEFLRTLV